MKETKQKYYKPGKGYFTVFSYECDISPVDTIKKQNADLLEALETIASVNYWSTIEIDSEGADGIAKQFSEAQRIARAAIKKAKGDN